jgi:hypothetical protein
LPVRVDAVVGCSNISEVETLAEAGRSAEPLEKAELDKLVAPFRENARELAFYRGII